MSGDGDSKIAQTNERIEKTDEEWRQELTPEQYQIARQAGTEAPFTGKYHDSKDPGTFHCVCCDTPLFNSGEKFDSGTGWPSFWQPVTKDAVETKSDRAYGMVRNEVVCAKCDAHLGHVFPDGPPPTGLRYCMNSASMDLKAKGES
jgi:peptide-methionine (R)-S-oxide reductase